LLMLLARDTELVVVYYSGRLMLNIVRHRR
jgi:hypothetical protein